MNTLFTIFDTESRFNIISSPILLVMDSEAGNFTVGSDVPTLGGETIQRDGSRTREINNRASGVIFDIKPIITAQGISKKFEKSDILLLLHVRTVSDNFNSIDLDKSFRKLESSHSIIRAKELF